MSSLRNLVFVAISMFLSAGSAKASLIIDLVDPGNGTLLMTYSGSINMSTLGSPVAANYNQGTPMFSAFQGYLRVGSFVDLYNTGSTSPQSTFGTGGQIVPTFVSTGSSAFAADFVAKTLSVPTGYVSGSPIAGSATFSGSLSSNGINAGTYMYSWGSGITESVVLNVSSVVPEPGSMAVLAIGSIASGVAYRRRRKMAVAKA